MKIDGASFLNPNEGASVNLANTGMPPASVNLREIRSTDLDFKDGLDVVSAAQKFILPVKKGGGEPLVYPSSDPRAGEKILDWEGKPVGDSGIVFFNGKDKCWQAAPDNGMAVVILNQVTAEQAKAIYTKIADLGADILSISIPQLKEVLEFVRTELAVSDMYNSDQTFVAKKMTPARTDLVHRSEGIVAGLMKRDDRDVCQAIFVDGSFIFSGPDVPSQLMENGGAIVKQGNIINAIQPDIFEATYRYKDGSPIVLKEWGKIH